MFKKKVLKDQQILILVRLLDASTKALVFLALFGQLWSMVPWSAFQVQASNITEQALISDQKSIEKYPTTTDSDFDQSQVAIESEMIDERTANTKTFRKVDGTYEVVIYNDVIHYQKDGKWKKIDNSLLDSGSELETIDNQFKIKFPKIINENKQIKLDIDDYSIHWNVLNIDSSHVSYNQDKVSTSSIKELTTIDQSVIYNNVRPFTDLEYIVTGSKVKENIILSRYIPNFTMTFEYKLKGLSLIENKEGKIVFVNDINEEIFLFSDMIMSDKHLNESTDISFKITETGIKTYQVTIIPSDNWLKNASYPIMIDPTIESSTQTMSIYDTFVSEANPTSNYHNYSYLPLSNTMYYNEYRGLFSFDIPIFLMDKEIVHSTLTLTSSSKSTDRIIGLYENQSPFDIDEVNWYSRPSHSSDMIDYHVVGSDNKYIFDITKIVKEWQSTGNMQTPGFTIKDKYDYGAYNSVKSNESSESIRPVIEFTYIESSGMKDYWTYSSQDAGSAGTGYVSDFTGKLIFIQNELSFETEKQSFGLSLIYNIDRKDTNIGYGLGWQTNYSMTYQEIVTGQEYAITDGTGNTVHYFLTTCDSRFVNDYYNHYTCFLAEDGSGNIFYKYITIGSTTYNMITMEQIEYRFSSNYLVQITDKKTNLDIIITRNQTDPNHIETISDDTGNQIVLTYSSNRLYYSYLKIKQPDSSLHILEKVYHAYTYRSTHSDYALYYKKKYTDYDSNASFTTSPNIYYITDSNARITSTYESSGKKVTYTYDSVNPTSDKIYSIRQYINESNLFSLVDYVYDLKTTTMTDQDFNYLIYKFDDYGHTVNILDNFGNTQSFSFINLFSNFYNNEGFDPSTLLLDGNPNYHLNNHLFSKSDPIKTIENKVQNYSFEIDQYHDFSWGLFQSYYQSQDEESNIECDVSLFGECAIRMYVPSSSYYGYYYQTIYLNTGEYILSGYVKNDSTASGDVNLSITGDVLQKTSDNVLNDGEWHYTEVIVQVDTDHTPVTIRLNSNTTGDVYFDNIQLIQGFRATNQNIIENSSFELLNFNNEIAGWNGFNSNIYRTTTGTYPSVIEEQILGDYAIRMNGDAKTARYIYSDIYSDYINSSLVDGTLTVGGWGYSNSTPTSVQSSDAYDKFFRIRVDVLSSRESYGTSTYNSAIIATNYISFDSSIEGWQYQVKEISFETGNFIYLTLEYQGEGYVLFDQIQMYYEPIDNNYSYDVYGRIESSSNSGSETTTYDYGNDNDSRPTEVTTPTATLELGIEDATALVESVTYNNVTTEQTYNSYGQVTGTLVGDVNNYFTTSTNYLSSGFSQYVSNTRDEFNNYTYYYNDTLNGLLTAIQNAQGDDILFKYDDEGKLVKAIHVDNYSNYEDGDSYYSIVEYVYDSEDRIDKIIMERDVNGNQLYFYDLDYDSKDRIYQVRVNYSTLMTYTYETDGLYSTDRIATQTYGNGDVIGFTYNDEGLIDTVTFNSYAKFSYEYDQSGLVAVYNEHDANGDVEKSEYYTYDSSGRLKQMIDSNNNKVQYAYDDQGNPTSLDFTFDGVEQVTNYHNNYCLFWEPIYGTECLKSSTLYDRTDFNTQDGYDVSKLYDYESTNALTRLEHVYLTVNYVSLIEQTNHFSGDTTRINNITYTITGNSIVYKNAYLYDDIGNITFYGYYENNVLKYFGTYQYDELNQLIVEDVRDTQYAESNLQDTNYTKYFYYDSRGNITDTKTYLYGQNESMATDSPYSFRQENFDQDWIEVRYNSSYFYDDIYDLNIGQIPTLSFEFSLWQEQGPYFYLPAYIYYDNLDIYTEGFYKRSYYVMEQGIWYEFDIIFKVGNPTELVTPQDHIHYNYSSYWKDQLSSIDTITYLQDGSINTTTRSYSYDGQGNSTNISNFYFEGVVYDHAVLSYDGRQLAKIEIYSSPTQLAHTIVYTYNDQGYRTSKTIDSQTIDYFLHGDKVLYETDGIYGIIYTYDYDGSLISFNYDNNVNDTTPGTEYFYVRNQQGDITKVIDHTGNIIVEYVYDAWGNIINWDEISSIIIAQINPYTYRGYRYDKETNLYYLNSRYYDANIGRFINADGLLGSMGDSQSTNMYAYCANNPVMYLDPSGEFPILLLLALSGVILCAAASAGGYVAAVVMSIWDEEVRQDMIDIGWNPFNSDETIVTNSKKISFYKGQFVVRVDFDFTKHRSFSMGAMFLEKGESAITVKHEWGHFIQLAIVGVPKYFIFYGIPSMANLGSGYYYNKPWERSADLFGGVSRQQHSSSSVYEAIAYLIGIFLI